MPKDAKDHSVKHTCCGCMHIRTGVMVLQTLEILSNTFGIVVGVMAAIGSAPFNESIGKLTGSTRDDGYILTAVHSAGLLLSMFGLVSVVNRKVGGFTFYAYARMVILLAQTVNFIFDFNIGGAFGILISIYWCYVYYSYIDTMKAEIEEIKNKAAATATVTV